MRRHAEPRYFTSRNAYDGFPSVIHDRNSRAKLPSQHSALRNAHEGLPISVTKAGVNLVHLQVPRARDCLAFWPCGHVLLGISDPEARVMQVRCPSAIPVRQARHRHCIAHFRAERTTTVARVMRSSSSAPYSDNDSISF